jgi:RHS repeat-associated protein
VSQTGAGKSFTYDPNGNLTTKTEGTDVWGYEWNAENQLTRVTKNSLEQAGFAYDPLGRRVEKLAGGATSSFTYDRDTALREVRGGTTLKYVHGPGIDEPLALDDGTALSYLHADGLGSIVKATSVTGAVTLTRQYDAWGNLELGANEPGYSFTGREWDPEVGLVYFRARFYDARSARFISEDPLGLSAGFNTYVYLEGNPIVMTDPMGLAEIPPMPPPKRYRDREANVQKICIGKTGHPYACNIPLIFIDCHCRQGTCGWQLDWEARWDSVEMYVSTDSGHSPDQLESHEMKHLDYRRADAKRAESYMTKQESKRFSSKEECTYFCEFARVQAASYVGPGWRDWVLDFFK